MTGDHRGEPGEHSNKTEEFLRRFFGEGNDAGQYTEIIEPFVESLRRGDDAPIVLPRYVKNDDHFVIYVITRNPAHTIRVAELLEAFAGPTYCTKGDTAPALLDPNDSIEAAIIDFAGSNGTFVLHTSSNRYHRERLRKTLTLMQRVLTGRPARLLRVVKPLGRLLAEFEASLAAGGEEASKSALDQLAAQGGITATNLAHLRIKRLDRLGCSEELLSMDGLPNVLIQDPPLPVKQAVLNAIYSAILDEPLGRDDFAAARDGLRNADPPLPLPVNDDVRVYGDEAATVLMTATAGRGDVAALERMTSAMRGAGRMDAVPQVVWQAVFRLLEQQRPRVGAIAEGEKTTPSGSLAHTAEPQFTRPQQNEPAIIELGGREAPATAVAEPPVESWPALFAAVAAGRRKADAILRDETWRRWPSPAETDDEIAQVLDTLDDTSWSRVWEIAGAFIEAVDYERPAPRTARAFVTYALTFDRLATGDLIALHALTEIFLRSSPSSSAYRNLLSELQESCAQWVSPENSAVTLDFVDRLVLAACPDDDARTNLAVALLEPLNRYQGRLGSTELFFAHQLSNELKIAFEWPVQVDRSDEDFPTTLATRTVLLYSLDEAVLSRTSIELQRLAPALKVVTSHDKVASDTLKKKARNADVVALATRCAKHAATGFITENAKSAFVTYANGSGSASLLRAAISGLRRWHSKD